MSIGQFGYCGVFGCCVDPVCGYQILSSYFYVSQVSRLMLHLPSGLGCSEVTERTRARPFEDES